MHRNRPIYYAPDERKGLFLLIRVRASVWTPLPILDVIVDAANRGKPVESRAWAPKRVFGRS